MYSMQQSPYSNDSHNSHQSSSSIPNPNPNPNLYPFTPSASLFDPHSPGIDPYVNPASISSVLGNPVDKIPSFNDPNPVSCKRADAEAVATISKRTGEKEQQETECEVCKIKCSNTEMLKNHKLGKKHQKKLKAECFQAVRASPRCNIVMTRSKTKQDHKNDVRINEPNALEGRGPVRCDLCDIDCSTLHAYQTHLLEEEHKRKLRGKYISNFIQSQQTGIDGAIVTGGIVTGGALVSDAENLDRKAHELFEYGVSPESLRISALFKAVCPGFEFVDHLAGEKHMKMAGAAAVATIAKSAGEKEQETECEVCKIKCGNAVMLKEHKLGKKHKKNMVKQNNPEGEVVTPTQTQPMSGEPSNSSSPNLQTGAITVATVTDNTGGKDQQETEIPLPGWCEVCKTKCCPQNLESHKMGKKHKKNLVKQKNPEDDVIAPTETRLMSGELSNSSSPNPQTGATTVATVAENSGDRYHQTKEITQCRWCDVCNIKCNNPQDFESHKLGKKHKKNLVKQKNPEDDGIAPTETRPMSGKPSNSSSPNPQTGATTVATVAENTGDRYHQNKEITQLRWCEVCNIKCNSPQNLESHKLGKKHKKNLVKQKNPEGNAITPTETLPVSGEPSNACSFNPQNLKRKTAPRSSTPEDLEYKKRKLLEDGIQADAIRICHICNAISHNEKRFIEHLAGQKHASRVLKAATAGTVPSGPMVRTAAG
ncbi:Zinc finger protein 346-like protein [Drosera capensis]